MDRSTAKHLVLLAVATALFYWRTALTNQFTMIVGYEGVNYTYAWLRFWVTSLWSGHLPLWDPYVFCGRPFSGEMLPSAFYPLHLLFLLFPLNRNGLISPRLFHEDMMLVHVLCAYFTFALLREFRLSRYAAFFGACVFALGGTVVRMVWPPFIEAAIWLPAIFLFLLRALSAERTAAALLNASLSGLCMGMSILTGGLHFTIMQGIAVIIAILWYGASSPLPAALSRASQWRRMALILAVVVAIAVGAGAVQLFPAVEYGKQSLRFIAGGPFPATEKIPYDRLDPGLWPMSIVSTLFPAGFNGRFGPGEAWAIYMGVLPLFLAIAAVWRCWSNLWVRYLVGLAVFAFAYAMGMMSPLHGVLYALVPLLWVVRTPERFVYLITFAIAVLSAFGLERLMDRTDQAASWASARTILKWASLACAAALLIPAVFTQVTLANANALSLLVIISSCAWFAYLTTHDVRRCASVLLVIFVLFDLSAFEWLERNNADPDKPTAPMDQLISLKGAAAFLRAQPGLGRARVEVNPEPNIGDAYGVQSIWGGGGTALTSYSRLSQHPDLLNLRYRVRLASVTDRGALYADANWKVYENPTGLPRAWVVHDAIVNRSQDAIFDTIDTGRIDLRKTALVESPLPHALANPPGTGEDVRWRSYEADRISLDVSAGSDGLVVLSEMYYPGWQATVNGQSVKIYRVDGGFRGILVHRGLNRVSLEYVPVSVYAGGVLSLLTFAAVLVAWAWDWRLRRRRTRTAVDPVAAYSG